MEKPKTAALTLLVLTLLVILCAGGVVGDVLHLEDGSRIDGKLTFCDEEVCSIGKRRVERAQIMKITLRELASPSPLRDAGAILIDGSIRRGAFTGLTLGYVEIGGEEIDRETVAVIVIEAPEKDVLIGSDGSPRLGVISMCNAASCTFDGDIIPLRDIRWIGLESKSTAPPLALDADLIFVREQTITARLSAIDDQTVRTTHGNFSRGDVTWIRLATPTDDQPPGGVHNAPSPEQPPAHEPPVEPTAPPPPPGTPPPDAPSPPVQPHAGTPRRGGLWTGTMDGRGWGTVDDIFSDLRISVQVRMREYISPLIIVKDGKIRTVGTQTQLEPEGTVVRNTYRCRSPHITCSGEGSTTVTTAPGEQGAGHAAWITAKTRNDSMQETHGYDIPQGAALYVLGIDASEDTYPVTYRNPKTSHEDFDFLVWMAGTHPLMPLTIGDRQLRYLEDGKMIGSYTSPGSGAYPQISLSWAVCREGVVCQGPPLPDSGAPPTPPLCSEGPQLDFAKLCRDELAQLFNQLFPMLAEYERRQKLADQYWSQFKWAAAQCAAWKVAQFALETVLGGAAADLGEAGKNAQKVREILTAMIEGDYGGLVTDADLWEENPDFKNALEKTTTFIGYLDKAGSVANLLANSNEIQGVVMESCLGAVTAELHLDALKFVEFSRDAAAYYKENVAVTKNKIRSKTLECLQTDHAAWKACRDAAACRGDVLDFCGPDPMSGGS